MNRNMLYSIIGILAVIVTILGYQYYQEQQNSGVEINIDKSGISIEKK